jgi:uncharacterized protein
MAPYRILSLDGGGIRGVLTASLLERIEDKQPGFLSMVDLFAGTSTGGILALGLAGGMSAAEVRDLYVKLGNVVFADSLFDNIKDLGNLRGAQYSTGPLKKELKKIFGDQLLSDLPKNVVISSFELDNLSEIPGKRHWKPKFFHNFPGEDSDGHESVVDVALRTSAAPTYFPGYQRYIDGGVVANNPSLCALAQALNETGGNQKISNIRMLAVGTGYSPNFIDQQDCDWGLLQWAPHLVSIMMEGAVGLAHYQSMQLLGSRYYRVNPRLPVKIALDGTKQVDLMRGLAAQFDLEEAGVWMKKNFRVVKAKQPAAE